MQHCTFGWLFMAVLGEGTLRDIEPTKVALNIFDAPEKLEIVDIGNFTKWQPSADVLWLPFPAPLFDSFTLSELFKDTCSSVHTVVKWLNVTSPMDILCETPLLPLVLHGLGQVTALSWCQHQLLVLVLAEVHLNLKTSNSLPSYSYHTQSNLRSVRSLCLSSLSYICFVMEDDQVLT